MREGGGGCGGKKRKLDCGRQLFGGFPWSKKECIGGVTGLYVNEVIDQRVILEKVPPDLKVGMSANP